MRPAPAGKRPVERPLAAPCRRAEQNTSGGTNSTGGLGGASPTGGTSGIGGLLAAGRQDPVPAEGRDRRGAGGAEMGGAGNRRQREPAGPLELHRSGRNAPRLRRRKHRRRTVQRDLRRRHSEALRAVREFARPVLAGERHAHDDARQNRAEMPARRDLRSRCSTGYRGPRAPPGTVTATLSGSNLSVVISPGSGLDHPLSSTITTPSGAGPFPLVIGMTAATGESAVSIFTSRGIADHDLQRVAARCRMPSTFRGVAAPTSRCIPIETRQR